ncbi:hypothetical protein D3C81_2230890 [compost metagenome]
MIQRILYNRLNDQLLCHERLKTIRKIYDIREFIFKTKLLDIQIMTDMLELHMQRNQLLILTDADSQQLAE